MPEQAQPRMCIDAALSAPDQKAAAREAVTLREDNQPDPVKKLDLIRGGVEAPLAAVLLTGKKWQSGQTIRIAFLDGSEDLSSRVAAVANEWTAYANLNFEWVSGVGAGDVRITFNRGGSWSYIGTDCKRVTGPTMQFGWLSDSSTAAEVRRVVLHEFGHMLGLGHEHKSPGVDIPWDEAAVYEYYMGSPNNWSREQVDNNVLGNYAASETNYSNFDPRSIMLYPVDNSLTRGDYSVGLNHDLSETDKKHMGEIYPFPDAPEERPRVTPWKLFRKAGKLRGKKLAVRPKVASSDWWHAEPKGER